MDWCISFSDGKKIEEDRQTFQRHVFRIAENYVILLCYNYEFYILAFLLLLQQWHVTSGDFEA